MKITVEEFIATEIKKFVRDPNCVTSEECALNSIFAARLVTHCIVLLAPSNPHIPANYLAEIVRTEVEDAIRAEFATA